MNLTDDQCAILTLRGQVTDLEAEVQRWRKLSEDESLAKSTAVQKVTELEARVRELEAELSQARAGAKADAESANKWAQDELSRRGEKP